MIQDFSNVFVGKQTVRIKPVAIRGNVQMKKLIGSVVVGGLSAAIVLSLTCGLLIRSGMRELAAQQTVRDELSKELQTLQKQREAMIDREALSRTAGKLGLYLPEKEQLRRL